jgi:hypothetical protein
MWHVHPLLGNDREIGDGTAVVVGQWPQITEEWCFQRGPLSDN